jgi:chromosome partitioning protein
VRPLSLNLARAIELDGKNVVVIDTDPQRTAKMWAESEPEGYGLTVRHESESDPSTLEKRIKRLSADADFAVNGAAKIEGATGAAVRASHAVLVPVQPTPTDTWRRGQLWKL